MNISNFELNRNSSVFIVAELSANHNGQLDVALETVKAVKRAGANAIKLQTYRPDTMTLKVEKDDFLLKQGSIWDGLYLYDLYDQAYTPWEWHEIIFRAAKEEGLICFSSPFDKTAVDFLEQLEVPAYKVASFEITDIPLIEYIASKGKPVIISTGIAKKEDIELAVETCRQVGNENIVLLQCTSSYPALISDSNMIMVQALAEEFDVITGISDHTKGFTVPVVATSLGAKIIEKHFILDKASNGVDSSFSLDEKEFTQMVKAVREAELAVGKIDYSLTPTQMKAREFCRSLYIVEDMKAGDTLTPDNMKSIRPGYGIHPKHYKEMLGKKSKVDLERGTAVAFEFFED